MSRRNNRRARSAKPASSTTESQLAVPKSAKQIKKQKRRERRQAKQNRERKRMQESTVDSDGDIDAISESDSESEQQSGCRNVIKQEKMDHDLPRPFDFQRLRTAVTSIIKECVQEFGVGTMMDDYMDWQPEPPRPVYLVLKSEMPCYPEGKVRRY